MGLFGERFNNSEILFFIILFLLIFTRDNFYNRTERVDENFDEVID